MMRMDIMVASKGMLEQTSSNYNTPEAKKERGIAQDAFDLALGGTKFNQDQGGGALPTQFLDPGLEQDRHRLTRYAPGICTSLSPHSMTDGDGYRDLRPGIRQVPESTLVPILDCHHTWCCCGTPSDFYCAKQTWRRQAVDTIKIDKGQLVITVDGTILQSCEALLLSLEVPPPLTFPMTVMPFGRDQDCSLKNQELDVPAILVPRSYRLEQDRRSWTVLHLPCNLYPVPSLSLIISWHLCLLGEFASSCSRAFSFDLVNLSMGWNLPSSAFCKAGFVDSLKQFGNIKTLR
ncbi:hypothetical protein STEG23_025994, partial [Scotinomys teguina]